MITKSSIQWRLLKNCIRIKRWYFLITRNYEYWIKAAKKISYRLFQNSIESIHIKRLKVQHHWFHQNISYKRIFDLAWFFFFFLFYKIDNSLFRYLFHYYLVGFFFVISFRFFYSLLCMLLNVHLEKENFCFFNFL